MRIIFLFLCFSVLPIWSYAQIANDNPIININGKAIDAQTGYGLPGLMVLNLRSRTGIFGAHDGSFSVSIHKNDTIKFSVIGYATISICFKDSAVKSSYSIVLQMNKLKVDLYALDVFPSREFSEIKKDIDDLGVKYKYQTEGMAGLSSPITFLYERFSRHEQQKKKAAELYNDAAKKEILKELFTNYIKADISNLSDVEFDDFLIFCSLPEGFIKSASQYELVMSIKNCFELFMVLKKEQVK
jgi:hypothetical protein